MGDVIEKKTWKEFKEAGLLWFINSILHLFGWSIVIEIEDGEIFDVYPARVPFRGFSEESNSKGYYNVSKYLSENINELLSECDIPEE